MKNSPTIKVMKREIHRIVEKKSLYMLMILLPIVLFLFLAMIYKNKVVIEIPISVCDNDNSEISRMIIRSAASSRAFKIEKYSMNEAEIKEDMLKGNIQGAIYIPPNMEADIKKGKQVTISIYKNTANLIIGNMILKEGSTIIKMISAGVLLKKVRSKGLGEEQAMNIANPIRIDSHSMFNPAYNYENYFMEGILPVTLQMLIMIVTALLMSSEHTHDTIADLYQTAENKIHAIFIGKTIPHLLIHTATGLGIIGIIFPMFDIALRGSMIFIVFNMIYFITASFFMGFLISCITPNQMFATEVAIFINTPAFIFSGYTFPVEAMTPIHKAVAEIFPFSHYITGYFKVNEYGAPVSYALPEFLKLTLIIVLSIIAAGIALYISKRRLIKKAIILGGTK
jgi:ABC-2 type transport system permease protein